MPFDHKRPQAFRSSVYGSRESSRSGTDNRDLTFELGRTLADCIHDLRITRIEKRRAVVQEYGRKLHDRCAPFLDQSVRCASTGNVSP